MKKYIVLGLASLVPSFAFAQGIVVDDLSGITDGITELINIIFPVLLAVSVFVIVWGIFKFILNAGDEEARKTGRSLILWGIVGIFLMLSVWGLVNILNNTFDLDTTPIAAPDITP